MDRHIHEYFTEFSEESDHGHFHRVIELNADQPADWATLQSLYPNLSRGWYELSHVAREDRVDFTRQHWLNTLPYQPKAHEKIEAFFKRLDDVRVFITQETFDAPFEVQLIYSLKDNSGFYHGFAPATEEQRVRLQETFADFLLPEDYMAFLSLHDGFCKYLDTGLIRSAAMKPTYDGFQAFLEQQAPLLNDKQEAINPKTLIPFYESFGLHCYQCFWSDWYPGQEMGNVYYSGIEKTLSEVTGVRSRAESLAFATFLDWFAFYIEEVK